MRAQGMPRAQFLLLNGPAAFALLLVAAYTLAQLLGMHAGPHAPAAFAFGLLLFIAALAALILEPICVVLTLRQLRAGEFEGSPAIYGSVVIGLLSFVAALAVLAKIFVRSSGV
jgi:hypothetical protein